MRMSKRLSENKMVLTTGDHETEGKGDTGFVSVGVKW